MSKKYYVTPVKMFVVCESSDNTLEINSLNCIAESEDYYFLRNNFNLEYEIIKNMVFSTEDKAREFAAVVKSMEGGLEEYIQFIEKGGSIDMFIDLNPDLIIKSLSRVKSQSD